MDKPRISIAGCGFVGLVSAAAFASRGFNVIATTINKKEANLINSGQSPFYENGLDEILKKAHELKNLRVTADNYEAVQNTDITFISVGTPMKEDKSIDLSYIDNVSKQLGKALKDKESYHLIVDRSTILPGTSRNLIGVNLVENSGKSIGKDFGLCMQPEFLAEGKSVENTFYPDRIIIGEYDKKSGDTLENTYQLFYKEYFSQNECPIHRISLESAELVKYANNCFLATKVSFANEFANFAELIPNVDIKQVMEGIGLDYRINSRFLGAGAGFGGSCFSKDVNAIKNWASQNNYDSKILKAVLEINDDQAIHIVNIAEKLLKDLTKKKITILGLSFKAGTSDMREAPSIRVIKELIKRNVGNIVGYDPKAINEAKEYLKDSIVYVNSTKDALKDSECVFILTEWEEFKNLSPEFFIKHMKTPNVIDGRKIYDYIDFNKKLNFKTIGLK
ncbi:MAG: UDP-glucose/GDP-mannose dehydrogenase family protein [Candidatus Lokiarchaeota archaeon]|nr:UDP-glucose/GDP-mannose dehydrogenase family protein [Candidatus Lokiarchaeota archaeon]